MGKLQIVATIAAVGVMSFARAQEPVTATPAPNSAVVSTGITALQRARLAEKLGLIDEITQVATQASSGATLTAERRRWMLESLYMMPLEQIRAMGVPGGFDAVSGAIAQAKKRTLKALGDTATDLVYRPITPCRYIDTRVAPPAVGTTPYPVDLGQTGASYGGSAGCNIVTAANLANASQIAAVAMNVGIVNPQYQPGFLGARPAGGSNATSLVNWYQSGPTVQASNAAAVTTSGTATGTNQIEFFGTPTDLVVDVLGVFTSPAPTKLDCVYPSASGAGTGDLRPGSFVTPFTLPVACATGYAPVAIACEYVGNGGVPPAGLALTQVGVPETTAGYLPCAWTWNGTGNLNSSDFKTHTSCCRVPGH